MRATVRHHQPPLPPATTLPCNTNTNTTNTTTTTNNNNNNHNVSYHVYKCIFTASLYSISPLLPHHMNMAESHRGTKIVSGISVICSNLQLWFLGLLRIHP